MIIQRSRWVLVFTITTLATLPSMAQEPSPSACDELGRRAMETFETDPPRALQLFERVYAECPSDAVRFNIGVCLLRVARHAEAAAHFDALLSSDQMNEEQRAVVAARLAEARAHLGTAVFRSRAAPVELRVDDTIVCATPCTLHLDPGVHRAEADGRERSFEIVESERTEILLETPATTIPRQAPRPAPGERFRPSVLTGVGAGIAALGVGGIIGFGVRSDDLRGEFVLGGQTDASLASEGELVTAFCNASIGVAVAGGVLLLIDLLLER